MKDLKEAYKKTLQVRDMIVMKHMQGSLETIDSEHCEMIGLLDNIMEHLFNADPEVMN